MHKTVTMVFSPRCRSKLIAYSFPQFSLDNSYIQTVSCFTYLGHIISNKFLDDDDVYREIRNMFTRTNILLRKFYNCSVSVKTLLFKTYCLCLYDVALWNNYLSKSFDKFQSCYNKCVKLFFGYRKYDSVTGMLQDTGLPSFSTVIHNNNISFNRCWNLCNNAIVAVLRKVN